MTCTVTGHVETITGQPYAGGVITINAQRVWSNGDALIAPVLVEITPDEAGFVTVDLHPGGYYLSVPSDLVTIVLAFEVPEAETADLADLIDGLPTLTPPLVAEARKYRDEARTARDETLEALPSGAPGQVLGFDASGDLTPQSMPPADLPPGNAGQLVGYDANGLAVAVDAPLPQLSSQQW